MEIETDRPDPAVASSAPGSGFATARKAMIDSQLRPSGVNARYVLERMLQVPREDFVPAKARGICYMDRAVALGDGAFLAAPVFHGMMLQEAEPRTDDVALVVDGGSGYLPALLAPMVGSVTAISAGEAVSGEAAKGLFSLILVDGAGEQVPAALAERLAADGRILTGIAANGITRLAIGRRAGAQVALLPLAEIGIPALPQFARPKAWTF